jgi:hypothetical protein
VLTPVTTVLKIGCTSCIPNYCIPSVLVKEHCCVRFTDIELYKLLDSTNTTYGCAVFLKTRIVPSVDNLLTVKGLAGVLVPIPKASAEASQKNLAVVPVSS